MPASNRAIASASTLSIASPIRFLFSPSSALAVSLPAQTRPTRPTNSRTHSRSPKHNSSLLSKTCSLPCVKKSGPSKCLSPTFSPSMHLMKYLQSFPWKPPTFQPSAPSLNPGALSSTTARLAGPALARSTAQKIRLPHSSSPPALLAFLKPPRSPITTLSHNKPSSLSHIHLAMHPLIPHQHRASHAC